MTGGRCRTDDHCGETRWLGSSARVAKRTVDILTVLFHTRRCRYIYDSVEGRMRVLLDAFVFAIRSCEGIDMAISVQALCFGKSLLGYVLDHEEGFILVRVEVYGFGFV